MKGQCGLHVGDADGSYIYGHGPPSVAWAMTYDYDLSNCGAAGKLLVQNAIGEQ